MRVSAQQTSKDKHLHITITILGAKQESTIIVAIDFHLRPWTSLVVQSASSQDACPPSSRPEDRIGCGHELVRGVRPNLSGSGAFILLGAFAGGAGGATSVEYVRRGSDEDALLLRPREGASAERALAVGAQVRAEAGRAHVAVRRMYMRRG